MKRILLGLLLLVLLPASVIGAGFIAVQRHWTFERVWAAGAVHDEAGYPVSGATVFGIASWYDGHGMTEEVFRSGTDRAGTYQIKGPNDLGVALAVFATAPGHTPAWLWCRTKQVATQYAVYVKEEPVRLAQVAAWLMGMAQSRFPDCVADIVLTTEPARLEVAVRGDDGSAAGVPVTAYLEEDDLSPRRIFGRDANSRQLAKALSPVVATGQDGVARFEHLQPGRYHIRVADVVLCERADDCGNAPHPQTWGAADGVAVSRGGVTRIEVALSTRDPATG